MENKKRASAKTKKTKVISLQMDATFFFERAVQSLDRFHYDKALKYFRRAAEYEPDNAVNHCNLAGVLSEMGNYEESNEVLEHIVHNIDPDMTECYFYMANNYANMENFESAEQALSTYLETDPKGQFLEESEEMMELLSFELERPVQVKSIKSREGMYEHDKARSLLEEGKFAEAVKLLEKLASDSPDFMAARNNLALAYYYMGFFDKSIETIKGVLEEDYGNLHALCNLAIFYQHLGNCSDLESLLELLRKTYPYHHDHVFKLATTMGILGEHETALRLFRRLLKTGEAGMDPSLYHYTAVAAYNMGRHQEAVRLWKQAHKLDPGSGIADFYLNQLKHIESGQSSATISYHYHLPFEEQFKLLERTKDGIPEHLQKDPLVRSSFFWALRHGDNETKLQVIQAFAMIADGEVKESLQQFIAEPEEEDYLKRVAIFVLRSIGVTKPLKAFLEGEEQEVQSYPFSPKLPNWDPRWKKVMGVALSHMNKRYDLVQQHDLETLWVEFLTRVYPQAPNVVKVEAWAAALEYLTAKMHLREISFQEVAKRYGASVSTISKHVRTIDEACGLKKKMEAIHQQFKNTDIH